MNSYQALLHIPTGRWVQNVDSKGFAILVHSPLEVHQEFIQNFGDTKLHSFLNGFKRRDVFVVRSFTEDPTTYLKVR